MIFVSVIVFFLYFTSSVWSKNITTPVKNVPGSIIFNSLSSGLQKSMDISKYLTSNKQNDVDIDMKNFLEEYNRSLMLPSKEVINNMPSNSNIKETYSLRQAKPYGWPRTPQLIMTSLKKIVSKNIAKKKILAHLNRL